MKRLLSLVLSFAMALSLMPATLAAASEAVQAANALYERGLFKGTGTNADGTPIYDLDKVPTRNQAIIMLIRLLGKESEALAGSYDIPFTDVSESMRPYIGYAYTNGLTNGTTATTYSGENAISANQYVSFVLRTLGYVSGTDFEVSSALAFADKLGLTNRPYNNSSNFTRGDVAVISYRSLSVPPKGQTKPEPPAAEDKTSITDKLQDTVWGGMFSTAQSQHIEYTELYTFEATTYACVTVIAYDNEANIATYEEGTYSVNKSTITFTRTIEYRFDVKSEHTEVSNETITEEYTIELQDGVLQDGVLKINGVTFVKDDPKEPSLRTQFDAGKSIILEHYNTP